MDGGESSERTRRTFMRSALAGALGVATAGCRLPGDDGEPPSPDDLTSSPSPTVTGGDTPSEWDEPLEVVHGWYSERLQPGPTALASAFEAAHPEVAFSVDVAADTASERYGNYVERRLGEENPPGSFATTPGATLERFGYALDDCEASVWTESNLQTHVEPEIRRTCVVENQWAAVPISAHRVNTLFYNPSVLEAADVDVSALASVEDLLDALQRVRDETDATPLAHGGSHPWTTFQLLETLLVNQSDHDDVRLGAGSVANVRTALETAKSMLTDFTGTDATSQGYRIAADRLAAGRAAFAQQGSWLAGYLESSGHTFGEDWDAIAFPGDRHSFLASLSAFAYPAWNPTPTKTEQWLRFVGSEAGQVAFNEPLWSVPVREDCSTLGLGSFQTERYEELRDERTGVALSMTHGVGLGRDRRTDIYEILQEQFSESTYDVAQAATEIHAVLR